MTVAQVIAAHRTDLGVPHAVSCRLLGVSESWFYKWRSRAPTPGELRRRGLDAAVKECFEASGGTYGSPRVRARLRRDGLAVVIRDPGAGVADIQAVLSTLSVADATGFRRGPRRS